MKRVYYYCFFLCPILFCSCFAGTKLEQKIHSKPIAAQYTGGHHYYVSLALYTDSTFFYVIVPDMIPIQTRIKGRYSLDTASVTLYGKRRLTTFWKKPKPETFRIRGDELLMYSEEKENSKDGDFIKAYYTLTLEK